MGQPELALVDCSDRSLAARWAFGYRTSMPAVGSMDALDNSEIIEPHGSRTQAHRQPSSCEADGHEEAQLPSLAKSSREVGPAALRPLPLPDALWHLRDDQVEGMIADIHEAFEQVLSVGSTPPRPATASS